MSNGTLVLVATPIGNLGDLSPRAVEELGRADVVCCEDTRRSGRLLQHAGVRARELWMVNEHTEFGVIEKMLQRLAEGARIAVVTDAGMPGISDPGERLVAAAATAGYAVLVVPGPSAAIAALVSSGLSTARFVFEGFLPRKAGARAEQLRELVGERRTLVFYEAPHRLERTLADLRDVFGHDRRIAIARELTKMHEEVWRGTLVDACEWATTEPRGEFVLVVEGAPEQAPPTEDTITDALRERLDRAMTVKDAANEVAALHGASRREVYQLALTLPRARR